METKVERTGNCVTSGRLYERLSPGSSFTVNNVSNGSDQKNSQVQPRKVLIVDASLNEVQKLGAAFRRLGYEPLEATSLEAAKHLWMIHHPPLLIADVRLGQFNGLQLLLRAKSDRPDVRAVITCAFPDQMLEAETRRFGGEFMVKPFAIDDLMAALRVESQRIAGVLEERRMADRRQTNTPGFSPDRRTADRRGSAHH